MGVRTCQKYTPHQPLFEIRSKVMDNFSNTFLWLFVAYFLISNLLNIFDITYTQKNVLLVRVWITALKTITHYQYCSFISNEHCNNEVVFFLYMSKWYVEWTINDILNWNWKMYFGMVKPFTGQKCGRNIGLLSVLKD